MSEPEPSSSSRSSRVGTTLCGKWTLERLLGEGGMASVFVARHKIGRVDAIKILHPAIASSPQLRARFEQEAHVVNRFRHPGAVEIRDIDTTEDGAPFLVMEFLEGETLSARARRTDDPLDVASVLRMADQVLDVLAAAHSQGIIHRDIKPDNLLLLRDGRVKVLDFGIARLRDSVNAKLKTSTGTTLGTVSYMPPEQAKGIDIDARVDIYAVGATMFRLLAGRRVHEADTEVERLMKVISDPAPPLATVAPQVTADVCSVVDRALAFDRDRRYPDAASMQSDVRAVARAEKPLQAALGTEPATQQDLPQRGMPASRDEPSRRPVVEPPTVEARPRPQASPQQRLAQPAPAPTDSATRALPGYVHDVPTVEAPPASSLPLSSSGTQPMPASRPIAPAPKTALMVAAAPAPSPGPPPVAPVIPPAPLRPVAPRPRVPLGVVVAVAAGSTSLLVVLAVVVWLVASPRPDAPSAGDAVAAATASMPSIVPSAVPPPAAVPSPAVPFPQPPAQPAGHGKGPHHK
jgi:serine/threonine-protein kinase